MIATSCPLRHDHAVLKYYPELVAKILKPYIDKEVEVTMWASMSWRGKGVLVGYIWGREKDDFTDLKLCIRLTDTLELTTVNYESVPLVAERLKEFA